MRKTRCSTSLGIVGIVLEGMVALVVLLIWIALSELGKAIAGGEILGEALLVREVRYA